MRLGRQRSYCWAGTLLVYFALAVFRSAAFGQQAEPKSGSIRSVDFRNFSYPRLRSRYGIRLRTPLKFSLKNGKYVVHEDDGELANRVTFDKVTYGEITNDGRESALVVLIYHTGGSMQLPLIYIWSAGHPGPVMLWSFAAGDRADYGLHDIYAKSGDLIVELNDPDAAMGNCCSRRFIRTQYHWDGVKFIKVGKPKKLPNHEYDNMKE